MRAVRGNQAEEKFYLSPVRNYILSADACQV